MPSVRVNGVELYCEDAGQGPAVVYIHGWFASIDTVMQELKPLDWTWEQDFAACFHFVCAAYCRSHPGSTRQQRP